MELFGWIAVTLGMVLFIVSFVQMVRPNPDARIPYFRNPEFNPSGTIAARSISVGLLVIVLNYMGVLPGSADGGNGWYLVGGLGSILAGIMVATQYR